MTKNLAEIAVYEGMTVRTVVETINMHLREMNVKFVETPNEFDGKVTYVIAQPNHA